ncbi:class III extradiol dioxygenase subunit B-like domain-containing protein [Saccharothrix obliqua]|uniref:class III extradiol dioxygenase subunit B-like domain-containing protein n=1 Tax=Saccharothrix obliqua TaxID=2861747 RepID=UPI001C5D27B0|nr:class III extradiol dioxygenase subunit B-like domain-containing protein [Saccharothrix obliqua]MBW4722267.1 class III extradiol dioxygenase subunit B-like domain-containing protein [Saccharothrix obliqua]
MISRVAVVPHPPLLVPELVGADAPETAPVRSACLAAARELAACAPDWTAVAVDPSGPRTLADVGGSFRGFGVDVRVSLSAEPSSVEPALPLPALVAGWLREQVGARSVRLHLVPPDMSPDDCVAFGSQLGGRALLVLGDGSHRHGEQAVGRADDRAGSFDEDVRAALAAADPGGLRALDPALADELGAHGRAAWQVLAGVPGAWRTAHSEFTAPFGVGYHVAVWEA